MQKPATEGGGFFTQTFLFYKVLKISTTPILENLLTSLHEKAIRDGHFGNKIIELAKNLISKTCQFNDIKISLLEFLIFMRKL